MEEIYAKYNRLMFSVAWRYTKDPHEVEDIVSDSCLKLMKNLATLKTLDVPQQQAYIVKTVKHATFDGQKKEAFWHERSIPIDAETIWQVAGTENVEESVELKEKTICRFVGHRFPAGEGAPCAHIVFAKAQELQGNCQHRRAFGGKHT